MSSGDNDTEVNTKEWMNNYPLSIQTRINKLRERADNNFTEEELESKANTFKLQEKLDDMVGNINSIYGNANANGGKTGKPTKPVKPTITGKKEILGKQRCIYKKAGDRKEYVKYKGDLITLKDYKKIISVKKTKK